jgi:hypothetical protein
MLLQDVGDQSTKTITICLISKQSHFSHGTLGLFKRLTLTILPL